MADPERLELSEGEVDKTVSLTSKDVNDAARLLKLLADPAVLATALPTIFPSGDRPVPPSADRKALLSRARIVFAARRIRAKHFDRDLFGEPAWEILLALYIAEESGPRFTISRLAESIGVPLSTVVRWMRTLEEKSLVGRIDHPTDRRVVSIRLLDKARTALDAYLRAIPE